MRRHKFLLFRVYRFRDASAYAQLYDQYFVKVRRYIFFKVPRAEDADELSAEVFLRGWEYATSSKVENPGALFYRIARNLIADFYRSQKATEQIDGMQLATDENILESLAEEEDQLYLLKALRQIKEEYRDVLVMRYLDGMSVKDIALILDKTPNNVRVLLHRAKKTLSDRVT